MTDLYPSFASRRAELVRAVAEIRAEEAALLAEEAALLRHSLASAILRLRKARDKTQLEVACAAGIVRTTLANIETEKQGVTLEVLCRLAGALSVEPWDLLKQALDAKEDGR
jgi:DNA-binding XRE family transcriptional regulator